MIVTCPSCTTRYFADDAAIGVSGRSVRCAACGHSWFVQAQLVLDQAAPDDLLPHPAPMPGAMPGSMPTMGGAMAARAPLTRDDVERMRRRGGASATATIRAKQIDRTRVERLRIAAMAWGGAGVALAATTGAAFALKEDVVQLWPQSASAFAAIGVPVNAYGLEFANLQIERSYDGPTPVLVVSGEVRNVAGEARAAPPLRFALRDDQSQEIYRWILRLSDQAIPAGGAVPFETVIDNPPIQAEDLEATFASLREAMEAGATPMPPSQPALVAPRGFTDEPLGESPPPSGEVDDATSATHEESSAAPLAPGRAGPIDGLGLRLGDGASSEPMAAARRG